MRMGLAIAVAAGVMLGSSAWAQQATTGTGSAPAAANPLLPTSQPGQPPELGAEQIKAIQDKLAQAGYSVGRENGVWGPGTTAAVMSFQQKHGLEATGAPDRRTLAAIESAEPGPANPQAAAPAAAPPQQAAAAAQPANPNAVAAVDCAGVPASGTAAPASGPLDLTAACQRIASAGFQDAAGLYRDSNGGWRGLAKKDNQFALVWVDTDGKVGSQKL